MTLEEAIRLYKQWCPEEAKCDDCVLGKKVSYDIGDQAEFIISACGLLHWLEDAIEKL